ncbi:MAG: nucleotidyltransferase domain-containing protein [Methanobrevibacter sp.]|jgi:predicted nucleotidyltransferase|nr:nucleotidyltransferase domain-containing protein [Methanobrevibacter sp.]
MNKKEIVINFVKSLNHPEIEKIILFGSVVRGEDNMNFDTDILIITSNRKKIEHRVYSKVADVPLEMGEYVSAKILTTDDYNPVKNTQFICAVEKE